MYVRLSFFSLRRSHRLEKRGWIGGWAGRTGVTARGVKPFRLSRGTFDLDLPGGLGRVRTSSSTEQLTQLAHPMLIDW